MDESLHSLLLFCGPHIHHKLYDLDQFIQALTTRDENIIEESGNKYFQCPSYLIPK